jgi:quercetin dioxygenase-like cupin family protein
MKSRFALVTAALLLTAAALSTAVAGDAAKSSVTPSADIKWAAAAFPGVSTAAVEGDMTKGASHFFLKYDAGLVTPLHHHSADHYVTVVSGTLALTVDGKETTLGPGSFFALVNKTPHTARVVGDAPAVMLVDARAPWDVVPEAAQAAKK